MTKPEELRLLDKKIAELKGYKVIINPAKEYYENLKVSDSYKIINGISSSQLSDYLLIRPEFINKYSEEDLKHHMFRYKEGVIDFSFSWSFSIQQAWELFEEMAKKEYFLRFGYSWEDPQFPKWRISKLRDGGASYESALLEIESAASPSEAICKAWIKWKEVQ